MGPEVITLPWFAGSSNGGLTTIHAKLVTLAPFSPSSVEAFLLGCVESWELADHICTLHNEALGSQ
jgi:hypothetical protein